MATLAGPHMLARASAGLAASHMLTAYAGHAAYGTFDWLVEPLPTSLQVGKPLVTFRLA